VVQVSSIKNVVYLAAVRDHDIFSSPAIHLRFTSPSDLNLCLFGSCDGATGFLRHNSWHGTTQSQVYDQGLPSTPGPGYRLAIVKPVFVFHPPSYASALVQLPVAHGTITSFRPRQADILQAEMTTNR
jgi:hypothetical protein